MRDYKGALKWYDLNQTTKQIGFNPDGMCLKVCRTARDIGSKHLTAKAAQDATPKANRFHSVRTLRRGMVLYFDDPNDSNTAGHIVTMIGRVKGFDWDDLNDVLVETNSVVKGQLVIVRAGYFKEFWGDSFQFGSNYLNGVELDYPKPKPKKPPKSKGPNRIDNFLASRPNWDVKILDRAVETNRPDLKQKVAAIDKAVDSLPDDLKDDRVKDFKEIYKKSRILKMSFLNDVVNDKPQATRVRDIRNQLRYTIKSLL